nr:hypothetical protein [Tanacetum cinerariifolium]
MTSFGYRFNPRYVIKECSSCGTLYTRDCGCSKGTVEDKILVPKPPKNCARCTRCGYLVDGPNCQRCALLRQELKENLVTYSPDFQNSSEPSNASTNFVNDPREPYVVKQDNRKVDAFLAVEDEFTSSQFPKSYLDPEGDMLLFEAFLNDDHSSDFKTKSSFTSLNTLLEETNNFDNSLPEFITFSKVLFDAECESDSSDDQSSSDEDVLEKIVSKPLSEEEIIPMESLHTHDSSLLISLA